MAGFSLPKLRWLVIGAVAAGVWAMTQDPPSSNPKPPARVVEKRTTPTERRVEPARRPPEIVTSSIKRPDSPVERPVASILKTTERVNLRVRPDISAKIVARLQSDTAVKVYSKSGSWKLVTAGSMKGWVHGDYLAKPDEPPRPSAPVAGKRTNNTPSLVSSKIPSLNLFGGKTPIRKPQGGNCQCPYDLMLSGKQCGEHSAYERNGGGVQCYR